MYCSSVLTDTQIIEDLIPVRNVEFELKLPEIKAVRLVPENKEIAFTYSEGVCRFAVEEFTCKQVVVLEHK